MNSYVLMENFWVDFFWILKDFVQSTRHKRYKKRQFFWQRLFDNFEFFQIASLFNLQMIEMQNYPYIHFHFRVLIDLSCFFWGGGLHVEKNVIHWKQCIECIWLHVLNNHYFCYLMGNQKYFRKYIP